MASLAESVINAGQQQAQNAGRSVGDAVQAYHIASTAEHARQSLDMEKQKQTINTATWVASQYDKIGRTVGPAQGLLIDNFGKQMQQIQPGFNPDILQVLKKDPDAVRAMAFQAGQALSRGSLQDPARAQSLLDLHNGDLEAYTGSVTKMGEESAKIQAQQMGMAQARMQMLEETKRQHGLAFSEKATQDKIINLSRTNLDSLYRSEHILNDPKLPVTAKDLALAYNDYINAVAAGGAATEGKIARELPDTAAQQINELVQKYAGKNIDLRNNTAGKQLIDQLGARITGVKGNIHDAVARQAQIYHDMGINSGNPYVAESAKGILMQYAPNAYSAKYGGGKVEAQPAAAPVAQNSTPYGNNSAEIKANYQKHLAEQAHKQAGSR